MSSLALPDFSAFPTRAATMARIAMRRDPERQYVGALAAGLQFEDFELVDAVIEAARHWPEENHELRSRKAGLLFALTALLARARLTNQALNLAPHIPLAPGMKQILVFTVGELRQTFCWRVTPAYALVAGRQSRPLPVATLAEPYKRGQVSVDLAYIRRVLLPRRRVQLPILLLPHEHGLVRLNGAPYVILDGNHRVVSAYMRRRHAIASYILTEEEAAAVLISHSRFPPYAPIDGE